jgi:Putative peptidoglycan binding domain/LysM domain
MASGKTYTVKRGDTIFQIAQQNGFRAWEPIWMADENAGLRAQRESPHVLSPGDKLFIPEKQTRDFDCETNLRHVFRVPSLNQWFQQTLLDSDDQPLAGMRYELSAANKTYKGETGSDGTIKREIPLSAKSAELKVWIDPNDSDPTVWKFQIGHLEPVDTVYGLKGRLTNLGYDCGGIDDKLDDKTTEAIEQYQRDHNLDVTGENDDATQASLLDVHDRSMEP